MGYQATADAPNTVSFGHDKGDVSGYTVNWDYEFETDAQGNIKFDENGMPLVKAVKPNSITTNYYNTAKYNRLVKAADGIEDHDAVVMEQLKNASGVGSNVKVYKTDENGNVQFDENNNPIEDTSDNAKATREAAQKASEDAWGAAIGTGKVADPTKSDTNDPETNGSKQLVTGGTVYNALQQQKNDLTNALSVHAGWGINITDKEDESGKVTKNFVSLSRNLGRDADTKDKAVLKAAEDKSALVIGGRVNPGDTKGGQTTEKDYGALGQDSVTVGGADNTASGDAAVVVGGLSNTASAQYSTVVGGSANDAVGNESAVFGGHDNDAYGTYATSSGGSMNRAYGEAASVFGGGANSALGASSVAVGGFNSTVNGAFAVGIAGGSTNADYALAAGKGANVTVENGTAIGYQATTDEAGTIAFGHDKGDVSGYSIEWNKLPDGQLNGDGTTNDYTKAPKSVTPTTYNEAAYNRLVKVADGIDDHDVVVMEQLKQYAEKDASNLGNNIKVYKTDENGNVQLDENKKPIEDKDATTTAQKANKDAWGKALGAGTLSTADAAKNSDQLVTGKTLYDYDKPIGTPNYVSANNTTGQNLSALDAQVKANADTLNDKTHNIKYYSVNDTLLPKIQGKSNEDNKGAQGMGSMAAGFNTYTDGIISTVSGAYSQIINEGNVKYMGMYDIRGTAAASYGAANVNKNTAQSGEFSGVANSTIGQVNDVTDSNAAITIGAGNTISNSYRDVNIDLGDVYLNRHNPEALRQLMKDAVKESGGQVLVMGGGNEVDSAYMSQVVGVGNTVKGNQVKVKNEKTGEMEWGTDTNKETAIKDYNAEKSSQLNYVNGFYNTVINGKSDYVIGAQNTVEGNNVAENQSNIIFGDNHKLTNQKNNVIIGSSDTADDETTVSDVVAIGHNAKVSAAGGVAIGSGSAASVAGEKIEGYDPTTGKASTDETATWKATKAAVSIGKADGTVTRQINGLAAGTNDTDAVNVAQLKSLRSGLTEDLTDKGLIFAANEGNAHTAKLGSTVKIQGTDKKADHEYTADNLTTEIGKDGTITIMMDKNISADKIAVNGKDGKDAVSIAGKDGVGHIGLTGPAGTNGMNGADGKPGTSIDISVKNGYNTAGKDGKDGINGENGVDGTSLTRIVYEDATGEHQIATMEDGLKFKGDDDTVIAKKLNNTLEIIGGADSKNLTDGNIGVNSTDKGQLKVQLAKDLKGITSISNQKTEGDKTTGAKIDLGTDGSVDVNGGKITNVGSGIEKDANGKYTVTDQNKGNAANIGDVQNMVNDAKTELTDGANGLNKKANIDASNIGANLKGADGKTPASDAEKTANENAWGKAIGTGKIEQGNGQLVTGDTVYNEVRPKEDGSYVKKDKTTGENLSALDSKIGKLDETKKYNYIDSGKDVSISDNLTKLDTQVKNNADAIQKNSESIQNITNNVKNLSDNAVQYDKDSNKSKVTLAGKDGTTITNVKDGALSASSTDAVNGKQLYNEQQAREAADKAITEKVTNNTNEITKIENGEGFTDAGKTVIKNLSKDAVQVKAGDRIKVDEATDEKTGNKTYTISANNNGTVAKGDGNLISGDTLYKEVHVDKDGSYIKSVNTVGQNLSALDTGLKTTSDLIHTNDKGDTIQIGGNSTATKIDVSGKDANGNTTGRVITGVVSDANDPNSAANVGYVKGLTAANTQQIYRDMNNAYSRLDTNINRAAAGSNALAALHPLDFDPADKASFAVGYGHYHNANAAAVGAFYQPNANTMVNMGISLGNGDPGFNAGVSFKIGKGSAYNGVSKAEMAQTIHDQAAEISTIKANDAAKDKRIDALEKENQEMKKQIQEILARLNG